jgi:hypothetical protein
MYSIGHKTLKLDGIITEFADIYAPLAQIWKNFGQEEEENSQQGSPHRHVYKAIKKASDLRHDV